VEEIKARRRMSMDNQRFAGFVWEQSAMDGMKANWESWGSKAPTQVLSTQISLDSAVAKKESCTAGTNEIR